GVPLLDLAYDEDSACDTDMNVVMNSHGHFIEVQGTAEGAAFDRTAMDALLDLAQSGIKQLLQAQLNALAANPA
ncbi:MAG: ribonuclease PH, partial [Burkholderiaceae bacterium]